MAHTTSDSKMSKLGKVFNDPIHGHIELHPLLIKIIDTPQFQRLRNIKQLGGAYYVYPGASHNRFEHSLGVAHLAGEFAQILQTNQPELNITDEDILCVQIAGLCHDLGHGPFSHLYDNMFLPRARPGEKWKHESLSVDMFDHLVKCNGLEEEMKKHNLQLPKDMTFIKEMIRGPTLNTQGEEVPHKGREKKKSFLYEIVANNRNGIDVDKFDYFARDCHHLGIKISFDHQRFFAFARVCEDKDKWQICSRDKEVHNLYDLFHARSTLHRKAYQHNVNKLIETMITEAFIKADPYIQIEGSEGKMFTLSTAVEDLEAYTKLTDRVFDLILSPPSHIFISDKKQSEDVKQCLATAGNHKDLQDAREILNRILRRDFYKFVGKTKPTTEKPTKEEIFIWIKELAQADPEGDTQEDLELLEISNWKKRLAQVDPEGKGQDDWLTAQDLKVLEIFFWKKELAEANPEGNAQDDGLKAKDFEVVVTTVDYGKKEADPISLMSFYSKYDPNKPVKISKEEVSSLLPQHFSETFIWVFLKNNEKSLTAATSHFKLWCNNSGFPVLKVGN